MCGIVGYVGCEQAAPILLDGLKHLEYRGYDSAGIALQTQDNSFYIRKKAGGVKKPCLEELDLSLLSEVKRNEKGKVEIKLIDRLQVLEQLARVTGEEKGDLSGFLQAMQNGDET